MAKDKEFNSRAELQAYADKKSKSIAAAITKIDAAISELAKARAKSAVKPPAGYDPQEVAAYVADQSGRNKSLDDVERSLANAKARAKEAMALCKV